MTVAAVGFDFFGTLVEAKAEAEHCITKVFQTLQQHEITPALEAFRETYREVASTHRRVRRKSHREVSNCIVLTETLQRLGYDLAQTSQPIVEAVDAYFSPWALTVYDDVWHALKRLRSTYRLGVISNFTYTPFLRRSLRRLGLEQYFERVLVSDEVGWRKPHPFMFQRFLQLMGVKAGDVLFVGDDYHQDVVGSKEAGMRVAWIRRDASQRDGEAVSNVQPDFIIHSLDELEAVL
jgi:putative hydrolase of the HAD superfamily